MKKRYIILWILLAVVSMSVTAQKAQNYSNYGDGETKLQWEGVLGFNLSNVDGVVATASGNDLKWSPGGRIGAVCNYYFNGQEVGSPYINGALLLSLRGFQYPDYDESRCNAFFFDVPIHFGYRFKIGETAALFLEAGPYVGIGAFGKYDGAETFDIMKRFDFGISDRLGVDIQKFVISAGFDYGLLKAIDRIDGSKNQNLHIDLGYKF